MRKNIITISREFGSGGRYIGELVAEKLGYKFYDKIIMERIAEETGLAKDFIEKAGEYAPSKSIFAYSFIGRNIAGVSVEDYLNNMQRKIILDIAQEGSCVIVGRCADYILKDRNDCVNVFIHGNMPKKIERIVKLYGVSEAQAEKNIKETDKKRSIHYKYYTGREWGDIKNYTAVLNSSDIGINKCADIIADI